IDATRQGFAAVRRFAELRQHRHAPGRDIFCRRFYRRAMVGEGIVVEIVVGVVDVESRPAAVAVLHALYPFNATIDGLVVTRTGSSPPGAIHCHDDDGGIVEIWIMWIGILEGPAARAHLRAPVRPISSNINDLTR